METWLFIGQSNMVGYGQDGTTLTQNKWDCEIPIYELSGYWGKFENATTDWSTLEKHRGGWGPEVGFARAMAQVGRQIRIIKIAFNGHSINSFYNSGSEKWKAVKNHINYALGGAEPAGCVFLQGSSDSLYEESAILYEGKLRKLVRQYRELWNPDLKFVFFNHPADWSNLPFSHKIRESFAKLAAEDEKIVLTPTENTVHIGDILHYHAASLELLGVWAAQRYVKFLSKK